MAYRAPSLHILFFPFLAPGHMIPMVDMAKLFAVRGVETTILTTPANAPLMDANSHHITLHIIPFPSVTAGLPEGYENFSTLPSPQLMTNFLHAVSLLREPFDRVLADLHPDCVVTDSFLPWSLEVSNAHSIPRLVFHGKGFFSLCAEAALDPLDPIPSDVDTVTIPGLPDSIVMLRSQILDHHKKGSAWCQMLKHIKESESKSYRVVVNSFYELEPNYADHYQNVIGLHAWHIGPVSLCNESRKDKISRGNTKSSAAEVCMNWLDNKSPGSVVYVCFGTMTEFTLTQLNELALGLEASGQSFIWVVRDNWVLPEGLEERVKSTGLIVRSWVPQILVLSHAAMGVFVTHCGWNSVLEGVSTKVPMVTWPMFGDQFHNQTLVVKVLRVGMSIGMKVHTIMAENRPVINTITVETAIRAVMGGDKEAVERRRRVKEIGETSKKAMEEGGSSSVDLDNPINELIDGSRSF